MPDINTPGPSVSTITRDADYTLPHRSTPLSEFVCPKASINMVTHTVALDTGIHYICSCGCEYDWESPLHYNVTVAP